MPWIDGEPPKDGKEYVCLTPSYKGPVFLCWCPRSKAAFRDWDGDSYHDVTKWHPLDAE